MDNNCQIVVFSDKAYNAIIRETFEWEPVETGGILLGHILDNGCWIVMDVLPPGYGEDNAGDRVFHEYGYFEYNRKFVNYLAKSVAEQYEIPLELLGLWHRHPGSMDCFSGTDDGTNYTFAAQSPHGAVSGLINVDPRFRVTMYYLSHADAVNSGRTALNYQQVQVEVGSDLIPKEYFRLRYYHGEERDLHPHAPQNFSRHNDFDKHIEKEEDKTNDSIDAKNIVGMLEERNREKTNSSDSLSAISSIIPLRERKTIWLTLLIAIVLFVLSIASIKRDLTKALDFWATESTSIKTLIFKGQAKPDGAPTNADNNSVDSSKTIPQ